MITISLLFAAVAMLIDYLRQMLFKMVKVNHFADYMESMMSKFLERLFQL